MTDRQSGQWITNANITPLIRSQTGEKVWDSIALGAYVNYPEDCWAQMLLACGKAEDGHLLA